MFGETEKHNSIKNQTSNIIGAPKQSFEDNTNTVYIPGVSDRDIESLSYRELRTNCDVIGAQYRKNKILTGSIDYPAVSASEDLRDALHANEKVKACLLSCYPETQAIINYEFLHEIDTCWYVENLSRAQYRKKLVHAMREFLTSLRLLH